MSSVPGFTSPPESDPSPATKPENVSVLSLNEALALPVPSDPDASARYVRDMHAVLDSNEKKSFVLARRIGQVVKAYRAAIPHAHSKGVKSSWEDRCKQVFGFTARTARNYVALLDIPENADITLKEAYLTVGVYRSSELANKEDNGEYKDALLAMLTPTQRKIEINGKTPDQLDDDELAQIVQQMTGISKSKLPKRPKPPLPSKPTRVLRADHGNEEEQDPEDARNALVKDRVEIIKRLIKRFDDAGRDMVAETTRMLAEIQNGEYTGAHYSSAKEGAVFKDAVGAVRGALRNVYDGIDNIYELSKACAHDDLAEIDDARRAFHERPLISPPAIKGAE